MMAGAAGADGTGDAELLARIAAGSEQALADFYRRYQARVYNFAQQRLDNAADAAEVLNEVMLEVWRGAQAFQGRARVSTWLLGIAHHKSIDLLRKRGRREADSLDFDIGDDRPDPGPTAVAGAQDSKQVRICLGQLPDAQRQVVYLTFFEDLPYPEIARILEIPEGTVKTRMFHARKSLAHCLEGLGARL
jgi:RNA polymerase sigma-70 factor (ECF subfamily)